MADWDVVTQDDLGNSASLCPPMGMWKSTILLTNNTYLGMVHDRVWAITYLAYPKAVYYYKTSKNKL